MNRQEMFKRAGSIALATALCLSGCSSNQPTGSNAPSESKQYTASTKGFGGEVSATLTFEGDKITDVVLTGDKETETIGGAALATLKEQVMTAQSADIDGVSGATITSTAVKNAVTDCIAQAAGTTAQPASVADGVYTGSAQGFMSEIKVQVTIADSKIADIEVTDIADTRMIGNTAAAQLAEDIVAAQSLNVDAVSGATVTSNGVFSAVSVALKEAGADNKTFNTSVEKRTSQTTELTTQVVVIGGGMAGFSAAIEAAEQGAEVILLEKTGVFGGSTTRSEGFVMGAGTDIQKQYGIEDTAEAMYNDMYELYQDEPTLSTTLLRKTVDESGALIDWLVEHGVNFVDLEAISPIAPRNIRRSHISENSGDGLMEAVVAAAKKNDNITIMMNTAATEVIKENGTVVGVKATNNYGDDITIHAGATILCAGSYGGNPEMLARLNPDIVYISGTGCGDGDGWTLAENAGADMIQIGYLAGSYMYFPYGYWNGAATLPGSPTSAYFNVLQVNSTGKRLVNEDAFTFDFGDPLYDSGDTYGWAIAGGEFDSAHPELYTEGLDDTFTVNGKDYCLTYRADTIEELAELTDMDAATLKATIDRYNASCDAGVDEEFGKDPQYMERIDAPYVAYMLTPVVSDGYSGCRINENAQVLDTTGQPIEGFYAAGACALPQIIGNRYFGCGSLIMTCGVYGRTAGEQAAKLVSK